MLLIYTHKITNRFSYIARHLFGGILGIEHSFTTKVEDFIKHKGPKITYTKQPLQNEFFIQSNDLLFEQGISDIFIKIEDWDEVPCFFPTGERSNIPFDVLAASFYMLSRYEEYLPHVKDEYGRYPVKASLLFKAGILKRPLVDLWAERLLKALQERFPELQRKKTEYTFTPIIKVATSHCFAHRGVIRSLGGFLIDLSRFRLLRMAKRVAVWFNPAKDPYNNYAELLGLHKKYNLKALFFFQFADYGRHDKNVSIYKNRFRFLIKWIADYSTVALSASYQSTFEPSVLKIEKQRLTTLINRPVRAVRLRYNRVNIPATYRNLVDAEFTDDFSMGYTHQIGFRAGTCTPFYFYDINLEIQQPLKVHPFALFDYSLINMKKQDEVFEVMDDIYREVKRLKGQLVVVFSNELLGTPHKLKWMQLYQNILKRYYV